MPGAVVQEISEDEIIVREKSEAAASQKFGISLGLAIAPLY